MLSFTPQELAERWKCTVEHIHDLHHAKRLKGYSLSKPGSKRPRRRFTAEEVARFEAGDQTPAKAVQKLRRKPSNIIEFYK